MKIVQSFWSGPKASVNAKNILAIPAGWISPEYHWMSWALSCLQLRKFYDRVELVTDEPGRQLLIDTLGLPYTSVSTALQNSELDSLAPKLWAMPKVYTYGLQQEPFLHVDGDIYIAEPFSEQLMAAPIITQNPELDLHIYPISLAHIERLATYLPPSLVHDRQQTSHVLAYNAGILGGSAIDFFQAFKREAFTFIERNQAVMPELLLDECFNTIPEQYLLHTLAQEMGVPIACLFEEPVTDIQHFEKFVNVLGFPHQIKYLHMIGAFKRLTGFYNFMANTLRQDYPAYYYKILRLCREQDIPLHNPLYHLPGLDPRQRTEASYQSLTARYLAHDPALPTAGDYYSLRAAHEAAPSRYFATTLRVLASLPTPLAPPEPLPTSPLALQASLWQLADAIADAPTRQLVADALRYDAQRLPYLAQLASDDYLYGRKTAWLASQRHLATMTRAEFFAQRFHYDTAIGLVESGWDWTYTAETDWPQKIRELLAVAPGNQHSAWLPNLAELQLDELPLDDFDQELLHLCRQAPTGEAILEELSQQFPPEELANNWEAFCDMVYSNLDRALFYGLLRTSAGPAPAPIAEAVGAEVAAA
jgi:hypothetical protein